MPCDGLLKRRDAKGANLEIHATSRFRVERPADHRTLIGSRFRGLYRFSKNTPFFDACSRTALVTATPRVVSLLFSFIPFGSDTPKLAPFFFAKHFGNAPELAPGFFTVESYRGEAAQLSGDGAEVVKEMSSGMPGIRRRNSSQFHEPRAICPAVPGIPPNTLYILLIEDEHSAASCVPRDLGSAGCTVAAIC